MEGCDAGESVELVLCIVFQGGLMCGYILKARPEASGGIEVANHVDSAQFCAVNCWGGVYFVKYGSSLGFTSAGEVRIFSIVLVYNNR